MLSSLVFQPVTSSDYSQSSTQPYVWSPAHRDANFSATRPPLAASQTARRVQAVYVGTSLLVRRRTILPGGPDHAVGRCNCQTWSQICRIEFSCSATNYISSLRDRSFAAAGPRAWNKLPPPLRRVYSADTFKRQLKGTLRRRIAYIFFGPPGKYIL